MDRKDFLTLKASPATATHVKKVERRTSTGLSEYAGPWTKKQALHLLRRTLFGVKVSDMNSFAAMSMTNAVDAILNTSTTPPQPPLNNYGATTPDPNVPLGSTWVNAAPDGNFNFQRNMSFKNWYWGLAAKQDSTILEKMVLFLHNLIPIAALDMPDARFSYYYNKTLRDNALGNYKTLIRAISVDPGMLVYLNGIYNTKTAPDENYARELFELFTLGKGADSKYTEDDVKAAARVLTGWSINWSGPQPVPSFILSRHDTGNKQFSSFFGNKVIAGQNNANAGYTELDELLNMTFSQTEVAKYICRRLYRFFVYYDITADVETNIITPLADVFRNNNYELKPVLSKLLKSEHFYDALNLGCVIKDPISVMAGFCRQWEMVFPTDVEQVYSIWNYANGFGSATMLWAGDPPNVAGWPAWYQEPSFLRSWITSDSLPKRNQFTDFLLYIGYKRNNNNFIVEPFAVTKQFSDPSSADQLIADAVEFLSPIGLDTAVITVLKNILLPGGIPAYNWTDEWNQANDKANPNYATAFATVLTKLRALYKSIMNLSEFQLS